MIWHFNRFLLSKLHLLNREDANLLEWHNRILGSDNHNRHCTLEWVSQQFQLTTLDPTITVDTLMDRKRHHFDYLLTWAYAVWMAPYDHYQKRWKYARTKNAPTSTWWLVFSTNSQEDGWLQFPIWHEPSPPPFLGQHGWHGLSHAMHTPHASLPLPKTTSPLIPPTYSILSTPPKPPSLPLVTLHPKPPHLTSLHQGLPPLRTPLCQMAH